MTPLRYGLVVSRFNEPLTQRLQQGAFEALRRRGVPAARIDTVWVPGAFEIPVAVQALAASGRYAALVALGCVIRGDTHHYDAICREVARGVAETARTTGVPVGFGVIMATRRAAAVARAAPHAVLRTAEDAGSSSRRWNLGVEAAEAAAEMADVMRRSPCAHAARRANTR